MPEKGLCWRPQYQGLWMEGPGLGLQVCLRAWAASGAWVLHCPSPWLQLPSETVVHWLCTRSYVVSLCPSVRCAKSSLSNCLRSGLQDYTSVFGEELDTSTRHVKSRYIFIFHLVPKHIYWITQILIMISWKIAHVCICVDLSACFLPLEIWGSNSFHSFCTLSFPFSTSWQCLCWYAIFKDFMGLPYISCGFSSLDTRHTHASFWDIPCLFLPCAQIAGINTLIFFRSPFISLRGFVNHTLNLLCLNTLNVWSLPVLSEDIQSQTCVFYSKACFPDSESLELMSFSAE